MSNKRKASDRHIVWSDQSLDIEDWREDYKQYLEENNLDLDPDDENATYEWMVETNDEYLSCERMNLDIQLSQPIIVIGDIGRWNGRVMGYKMIDSGNIKDCLYSDTDYTEWYVDKYGDLRADAAHHDGINHYLYRVFKDTATESQIENLKYKLYDGRQREPILQELQGGSVTRLPPFTDFTFRNKESHRKGVNADGFCNKPAYH